MIVNEVNMMKYDTISEDTEATVMVRYNDSGVLARLFPRPNQSMEVQFMANVRGIAPGQSAVFYEGDDVIGGGRIFSSL